MKRLLILVTIVMALGLHTTAAQSADATSAWNHLAAQYNFGTTQGAPIGETFAQAYNGSDFNTDFAGILDAIAQAMTTSTPPYQGGDVMSTSLQNWPDP